MCGEPEGEKNLTHVEVMQNVNGIIEREKAHQTRAECLETQFYTKVYNTAR